MRGLRMPSARFSRWMDWNSKANYGRGGIREILEPVTGIEPACGSLQDCCSANVSATGTRVVVSSCTLMSTFRVYHDFTAFFNFN